MRHTDVEHVEIVDGTAGIGWKQTRRLKIIGLVGQMHPDVVPLPDIARLPSAGEIVHYHRERIAAVNHHRTATRQVFAEAPEARGGGELGVTAQQHQAVVAKANPARATSSWVA